MEAGLTIRRACFLMSVASSWVWEFKAPESRPDRDEELRRRLSAVARPGVGYRMARALVLSPWEREFGPLNAKRVYRVWKNGLLAQPTKRRKKRRTGNTVPLVATGPNQVWCLDFCHDACLNGDRFKVLALKDEYPPTSGHPASVWRWKWKVVSTVRMCGASWNAPSSNMAPQIFCAAITARSSSPTIWEFGGKRRALKLASLHPVRPGKTGTRKVLWRDCAPSVSMPKSFIIWPRPNSNWRCITATTITNVLTRHWAIFRQLNLPKNSSNTK